MEAEQTSVAQSASAVQWLPGLQGAQLGPPQSVSISSLSCVPSLQVGAWQSCPRQNFVAQSVGSPQRFSTSHAGQSGPPQSTSVSLPFFTASLQLAG
jgi:hypothetical protein